MDIPQSLFTGAQVPEMLWPDQLWQYGAEYDYHLAEGDAVAGVLGILTEGAEGEFVSPGRYARMLIDARDLPRAPRAADWIDVGDKTYDVEQVEETVFGISRLVIKLTGQSWLEK
jgi:hypothetical protein